MEEKKLLEVLQLCGSASSILATYSHYSKAPYDALHELYGILALLPPCIAILSAYDDDGLTARPRDPLLLRVAQGNTLRASPVFQEVSDAIARVLPFLFQYTSQLTSSSGGTPEATRNSPRKEGQKEKTPNRSDAVKPGDLSVPSQEGGLSSSSTGSVVPNSEVCARPVSSGWSSVVGCEEAVKALKQCTVFPRNFPQLFKHRRPLQRILLYGPPGTGKTLLAQAVATENNQGFLSFSAADLLSKWMGESEKHIQDLFVRAAHSGSSILFFDEIDALCSARGGKEESETSRRIKTQFLLQLQQIPSSVVVIAATNLPWEIDPAIRRRFDRMIYVRVPTADTRRELLTRLLKNVQHTLTEQQLDTLVRLTEYFTASDVVLMAEQAVAQPLFGLVDSAAVRFVTPEDALPTHNEKNERLFVPCAAEDPRALSQVNTRFIPESQLAVRGVSASDFDEVLKFFVPSVNENSVKVFEEWRNAKK